MMVIGNDKIFRMAQRTAIEAFETKCADTWEQAMFALAYAYGLTDHENFKEALLADE